jgi:putative iron-regulated protein
MPTRTAYAGPAWIALLSLLVGCAQQKDDPRRAVIETYANIVLATYDDSIETARALDRAVDELIANPSERTLEAARESWKAARIPYGYSEAFRFYGGPIDNEEDGPEPRLNGWPLDENHIDAVQLDAYNAAPGANIIGNVEQFPEITPELVAAQNEAGGEKNIASGYHAIEFLLWGQDFNTPPESAGQRPYTDFVATGASATTNARRGQYLKAATTLLIRDLESVAAQWREPPAGETNYRTALISGDVPTALKRMFTGAAALAEVEMAGERMNVPLLSSDQEEEQSCFSDTTSADLRANAAGIEHVYYGKYTRLDGTVVSGPSLADLVKEKDERVAQEVDARIAKVREAVGAIRTPFDREIHSDNAEGQARVQAAIDALRAEALSLTRAARTIQIFLSDLQSLGD